MPDKVLKRRLTFLCCLVSCSVIAQENVSIFLHTDKEIYRPGESVWFASYILNRDQSIMERQHVLHTVIIDTIEKTALQHNRFSIREGLSHGAVDLPDSLVDGNYLLVAYTDENLRHPEPVFSQPIHVRKRSFSYLEADFLPLIQSAWTIKMTTDTLFYKEQSFVTLSIHIQDSAGNPLRAIFSLGVTAAGKSGTGEITRYQPDTSRMVGYASGHIDPDYGYVINKKKPVKKPVRLAILGDRLITFRTDSTGKFELPYQLLEAPYGKRLYIGVSNDNSSDLNIIVRHATDSLDSLLACRRYPAFLNQKIVNDSNGSGSVEAKGTPLAALVTAKMNDDNDPGNTKGDCNRDIVYLTHGLFPLQPGGPDLAGGKILNWTYADRHQYNTEKPIEGQSYIYNGHDRRFTANGDGTFAYHCASVSPSTFMTLLDPVELPRNFSGDLDFLKSTIFWAPLIQTDENGDARISFSTNHLDGKFACTLQGLSGAGPIYGKVYFTVIP